MNIGCFALVKPFADMAQQFQALHDMGIEFADLTTITTAPLWA